MKHGVTGQMVVLSSANVLALNATPITLVAAQGAGTFIIVDSIAAFLDYGSVAYVSANALEFRYTDGSGAKVTEDMSAAFLTAAADTSREVKGIQTELTPAGNAPVVVSVPTADPTTGDSPITFRVTYRVINF